MPVTELQRLASTPYEKVWGTPHTQPWYRNSGAKNIGEVWFSASDKVPLLVKFLFTSENLSVQVHPGDDYAREHHASTGKTEMWHVLRADPGARVAIGLKESITRQHLRETCLSGEIMQLLNWIPARVGDTFFSESGTVHAIGGGLVLCEVQQYSDITYRLFDYGRTGRELHLDRGIEVARLEPCDGVRKPCRIGKTRELLAECGYFRSEKLTVTGSVKCPSPARPTLYIALEGEGRLAGADFRPGDAWEIPAGSEPFDIESPIESPPAVFLTTAEPAS